MSDHKQNPYAPSADVGTVNKMPSSLNLLGKLAWAMAFALVPVTVIYVLARMQFKEIDEIPQWERGLMVVATLLQCLSWLIVCDIAGLIDITIIDQIMEPLLHQPGLLE